MSSDKTTARTRTAREQNQTALFNTYVRPDFVLERGEGCYLYDTDGHCYLDFVAGIAVNILGYGDADILNTITQQAQKLIHVSNLYHTIPGGELAHLLLQHSPGFDRVFFANSGAEAVEGALKIARKYARMQHGEGKTMVVACDGSFHGRTMGAVAVTAREKYRTPFQPVMPDVRFTPFNDVAALEHAITDDVCALLVEPIQGEGGINSASNAFLQAARALCNTHDALLIVDEIQCGMGRSGTLWAHTVAGIQPDVMVIAKPLGGGLPIGAILATQHAADALSPGEHGTTFGGGPLVTAVAHTVLRRVTSPQCLAHIEHVSALLDTALATVAAQHPNSIREIRGRGLMRGIQVAGAASAVREQCHHEGLLIATSGEDVIRLLPPFIIEQQHINEAMQKLTRGLAVLQQ